jgi:hypothetical protein
MSENGVRALIWSTLGMTVLYEALIWYLLR